MQLDHYCTERLNSIGLIKFKEKNWFITQIKAGVMLSICLIFHQKKKRLGMLINVMLIKKTCKTSFIVTVLRGATRILLRGGLKNGKIL